jgi:hypothetical protein
MTEERAFAYLSRSQDHPDWMKPKRTDLLIKKELYFSFVPHTWLYTRSTTDKPDKTIMTYKYPTTMGCRHAGPGEGELGAVSHQFILYLENTGAKSL